MSNPASDNETAACPFCGRDVDPDLIIYGGKCPECFGEIPGEEAPTDPGEEKKAAEQRAAKAKVDRSKRVPVLLASLGLLATVGIAAFLALRPEQPLPMLNLDDAQYEMDDVGELIAYVEPQQQEAPVTSKKPKKPTGKPSTIDEVPDIFGGGSAAVGTSKSVLEQGAGAQQQGTSGDNGFREVGGAGEVVRMEMSGPKTGGSSASLDAEVTAQRFAQKGATLTDDAQIIDMALSVVQRELPKLRWQCYESELKKQSQDTTIQGSWLLALTVLPNGTVSDAKLTAKNAAHPGLEACVIAHVSRWNFQPIKTALPIQKTVTFSPSY